MFKVYRIEFEHPVVDASYTDIKHRFKIKGKGFKNIDVNFKKNMQIKSHLLIERISPYYGLEKLFSNLGSELQDSKRTKFDFTAILTTLL